MNTQRLEEGHSHYLAMLSPPDFEHLSSPHEHVNDEIHVRTSPNPTNTPSYMCMKSLHIFRFDDSNGEVASGTELLLMFYTRSKSEWETPKFTGFPSPSFQPDIPPSIK